MTSIETNDVNVREELSMKLMRVMATVLIWTIVALVTVPGRVMQSDDPQATIDALETQIAVLSTVETTAPESTVSTPQAPSFETSQEESNLGPDSTVNVEIIFDVSGSMAQELATGESRMDAAKRVLNGVVAAIPQTPGINVGLRIYGHQGDNSEAGRAVSCASSDLLVPLEGVDVPKLTDELASLQPTGWTPIALSLNEASNDFPPGDEDNTNAIVLVTDGLETCGGDPAAVAGSLQQGGSAITTHVIGFALTIEEQELLSGIADQGGGQLLGANSAEELSAALFSVLEELEVVTGAGYVGGNAFSLVPTGEPGELNVVAVGTSVYGLVPFVIRNNTSNDVAAVKVSGSARDGNGGLVAAGDDLYLSPHSLPSGGIALGGLYLGSTDDLPSDLEWEFNVEPQSADSFEATYFRDLDIVEANSFDDRIVGSVENTHDESVSGPISLVAVCFDLDGNLLGLNNGSVDVSNIGPGETKPFQVNVLSLTGEGCPAFLVAGSGTQP